MGKAAQGAGVMLSKTVPAPWAGCCTRIDTNPCFVTACDVWSCGAGWWRPCCILVATAFVARACARAGCVVVVLCGARAGAVTGPWTGLAVVWFLNLILRPHRSPECESRPVGFDLAIVPIIVVESFLYHPDVINSLIYDVLCAKRRQEDTGPLRRSHSHCAENHL